MDIDAHSGGRGEGEKEDTSRTRFKKLYYKNAIKHENRGPLPRFSHNPKHPPKKNVKMTGHLRGGGFPRKRYPSSISQTAKVNFWRRLKS
jgi:hypothetical protein